MPDRIDTPTSITIDWSAVEVFSIDGLVDHVLTNADGEWGPHHIDMLRRVTEGFVVTAVMMQHHPSGPGKPIDVTTFLAMVSAQAARLPHVVK